MELGSLCKRKTPTSSRSLQSFWPLSRPPPLYRRRNAASKRLSNLLLYFFLWIQKARDTTPRGAGAPGVLRGNRPSHLPPELHSLPCPPSHQGPSSGLQQGNQSAGPSPPSTPLPGTINGFTGQPQIDRPLITGSGMGLINP